MRVEIRFILLFIGLAMASVAVSFAEDAKSVAEEHAVYQTLLTTRFITPQTKELLLQPHLSEYVAQDATQLAEYNASIKGRLSEVNPQLIDEYFRKIPLPHILNDQLKLPVKWRLVEKDVLEEIFKGHGASAGWKRFYEKYPGSGGVVCLSRVAFNKTRTAAFLSAHHGFGDVGASFDYYLFRKDKGKWVLQKVFNQFVS